MSAQLLGFLGVVLAAVFGSLTGILAYRANKARNSNDREQSAGQLALQLAERHEDTLQRIRDWWPAHEQWDEAVAQELELLDPLAPRRLPRRPPRPF